VTPAGSTVRNPGIEALCAGKPNSSQLLDARNDAARQS
jgi:hypothetical protein